MESIIYNCSMNTIYICHLCMSNVSFTSFESAKQPLHIKWNLQITPQLTEYSITDHISINTYRIITNLFSSVIQLIQQAGLVIILLAHTLGTCDFFLPRVLSLIERVPFLHLFHLGTGRKARERKFCLFLFFFSRERDAGENNMSILGFDCRSIFEEHRRLWRVR